jgi:hypothetical protein
MFNAVSTDLNVIDAYQNGDMYLMRGIQLDPLVCGDSEIRCRRV